MNEFIPYLLILISWNPDKPEDFYVDRAPRAFVDKAACDKMGASVVQLAKDMATTTKTIGRVSYQCLPSASSAEEEAAFTRVAERLEEENERRYQREKAEYERFLIEEAEQKRKKAIEDAEQKREMEIEQNKDTAATQQENNTSKPKQ
jgi:hypothetical protein